MKTLRLVYKKGDAEAPGGWEAVLQHFEIIAL